MENKTNNIVIYHDEDSSVTVPVMLEDETYWMSQKQMSQLLGCGISTVSEHLKHIFTEGELEKALVIRKFGNTEISGSKPTTYLNLTDRISYRIMAIYPINRP